MAGCDGARWYVRDTLVSGPLMATPPVEDGTFPFYRSEDIAEERCECRHPSTQRQQSSVTWKGVCFTSRVLVPRVSCI